MQRGEMVEYGVKRQVLGDPQHACTRALIDAVPPAGLPGQRRGQGLAGATGHIAHHAPRRHRRPGLASLQQDLAPANAVDRVRGY